MLQDVQPRCPGVATWDCTAWLNADRTMAWGRPVRGRIATAPPGRGVGRIRNLSRPPTRRVRRFEHAAPHSRPSSQPDRSRGTSSRPSVSMTGANSGHGRPTTPLPSDLPSLIRTSSDGISCGWTRRSRRTNGSPRPDQVGEPRRSRRGRSPNTDRGTVLGRISLYFKDLRNGVGEVTYWVLPRPRIAPRCSGHLRAVGVGVRVLRDCSD